MSSYLNIYLQPKEFKGEDIKKKKPLLLLSVCRGTALYEAIVGAINTSHYDLNELTSEIIKNVSLSLQEDKVELVNKIHEYELHANNTEILDSLIQLKVDLNELILAENQVAFLQWLVEDCLAEYNDFCAVYLNID